jgi:hypothetical protein
MVIKILKYLCFALFSSTFDEIAISFDHRKKLMIILQAFFVNSLHSVFQI